MIYGTTALIGLSILWIGFFQRKKANRSPQILAINGGQMLGWLDTQRIFDTIMQMLRRNPELRVFAFHDCSPEGMKLANELRTNPRWFPDETIVIVDIGLSPRQILAAKRDMFIQSSKNSAQASRSLPSSLRENLSQVELEWLDRGNFVELESFTPQQLIQVLNRSIANSQQGELSRDTTLILVEGTDSYFRIYTTESFG